MERTKIRYECERGKFAFAWAEIEIVNGYAWITDNDHVWVFGKKHDAFGHTILGSQIVKIYKKKGEQ